MLKHLQYLSAGAIETKQDEIPPRQLWVDRMKGVAILGVFLNHAVEPIFGWMRLGYPSAVEWGTVQERWAQVQPLDLGAWSIPVNLVRYGGWLGDMGVALFILVSGFGLSWGLLERQRSQSEGKLRRTDWGAFVRRRFGRVYPMWGLAHLGFMATWLALGWGLSPLNWRSWLSVTGLRMVPGMAYYFTPAWWYIPLLLQLYVMFPFCWRGLNRLKTAWFLSACLALGWGVKAIGMNLLPGQMMLWHPGMFAIVRLPEFALGMVLAVAMFRSPRTISNILMNPMTIVLGVLLQAIAIGLGLFWWGTVVFPALLGFGTFLVLYGILGRMGSGRDMLGFLGRHSYSLFLVHHPILTEMLRSEGWDRNGAVNLALILGALGISIAVGLGLEQVEKQLRSWVQGQWKRYT
jgi:peptidoglycan/LPS O-acetylase OafA/YrhL